MRGGLSVAEVAEALGTSPQTVRALLRKGQLRGEQRPWGSRYVWEVSPDGVDEFLSQFGRLDGRRRTPGTTSARPVPTVAATATDPEPTSVLPAAAGADAGLLLPPPAPEPRASPDAVEHPDELVPGDRPSRPFVLRPRGRATVAVVVLGLPLLVAYGAVRIVPDALWFHELGQPEVYSGLIRAKLEFRLLVTGLVAGFVWLNLVAATREGEGGRRRREAVIAAVGAVGLGELFASAVANHWQTYLLWRHRQDFGVLDPAHGKDVGFFVFTLPFEVLLSALLLCLVVATGVGVAMVYAVHGRIGWRPWRASFGAQLHLALLAAAFLVLTAWRLHLATYLLELQQPTLDGRRSFAGAGYVDAHVRTPGFELLSFVALGLAVVCVATPYVVRASGARRARRLVLVPAAVVGVCSVLAMVVVPALVQRFVVDPNQLLSERPFVERSIVATGHALGLDRITVEPYAAGGRVEAADVRSTDRRLARVQTWDTYLLGDRMRQLVSDTPYFRPDAPSVDVVRVDGRRQPTVVSARELDLTGTGPQTRGWANDRLAYTHGLGLIRFSGTDVGPGREPRVLDSGLGVAQPRIYFGDFPQADSGQAPAPGPGAFAPTVVPSLARSPWVLVDTKRPEVDIRSPLGSPRAPYHYRGPAGIPLTSGLRRAVFALALGSKQVLLSHDLTPGSRLLLHRDVHDRLATLAPFLHWDDDAVPITVDGRIVFVVDGYTVSTHYPDAEQTDLAGTRASYARAAVRATVDAYTGRVDLYLTDPADPLVRAWADAFPTLFRAAGTMPTAVRERLRYPQELFDAQATTYQRFHTDSPDVLASGSDVWSRPIALAGPLEVAGGVDFDESDEDDLRLTLQPTYAFAIPPGRAEPQLVITTLFVPRQGQNLVATLTGWVDDRGRPRLASRSLARDPVTLGPAQVSRLVFATPRVRDLLGLRNLEIRDLSTSSLDSVFLGVPHVLFLPSGVLQVQSLFEGSRGPGAARLLGVTVFVNGRAGLGPDAASALRQALNAPPRVDLRRTSAHVTVGDRVPIRVSAQNADRATVTITSGGRGLHRRVDLDDGAGVVTWVPRRAGVAHVVVSVVGLDGTSTRDRTSFQVFDPPPEIRVVDRPSRAVVGEPVRFTFAVAHARRASVQVSTLAGIAFSRRYVLSRHRGVVSWVPDVPGRVAVVLRARGGQGQTAVTTLHLRVLRRTTPVSPTVELVDVPKHLVAGSPATFTLRADGCRVAEARIKDSRGGIRLWRVPCPFQQGSFTWTPKTGGRFVLTVVSRAGTGFTASQSVSLRVAPQQPAGGATASPRGSPTPARDR